MSTFRIVRLQAPDTDTTQDYTASDFGNVNPDVVLCIVAGEGNNTLDAHLSHSFGWYDGTTARMMNLYAGDDDSTLNLSSGRESKNGRLVSWNQNGATERRYATPEFITNGVRLTWSGEGTPAADRPYVTMLLIKGVSVAQGEFDPPQDATTAADSPADTITTTGVDPQLVFILYHNQMWPNSSGNGYHVSFGMAVKNGATADNRCIGYKRANTEQPTENGVYFSESNCLNNWTSTSTTCRGEMFVDSMGTDGFDVKEAALGSKSGIQSTTEFAYLALEFEAGTNVDFISTTTPTGSGDWTVASSLSDTPQAMMLWNVFSTAERDAQGAWGSGTMYVATAEGDTKEGGSAFHDEYNVSTTNCKTDAITSYKVYADDGTLDITASEPVFGTDSIKYLDANVDNASQATKVFGIAFGGGTAPSGNQRGSGRGIMRGAARGVG